MPCSFKCTRPFHVLTESALHCITDTWKKRWNVFENDIRIRSKIELICRKKVSKKSLVRPWVFNCCIICGICRAAPLPLYLKPKQDFPTNLHRILEKVLNNSCRGVCSSLEVSQGRDKSSNWFIISLLILVFLQETNARILLCVILKAKLIYLPGNAYCCASTRLQIYFSWKLAHFPHTFELMSHFLQTIESYKWR